MALTDKQRSELHAGIYDYFLSRGEAFSKCAEALAAADPEVLLLRNTKRAASDGEGAANVNGGGEEDHKSIQSRTSPSLGGGGATPLLEKKWTAVPRLQRRVLELERQLANNNTTANKMMHGHHQQPGGMDEDGTGRMAVRQRRNLPRPPAAHALRGHSSAVTSVALHPIYTLAASGSEDGTIKLWDHESGDYLRTLRGHTNAITSVDFSPKTGCYLVSSSSDLSIKLWDVQEEYSCVRTLRGHDHTISCVKFVPPNAGAAYLEVGEEGAAAAGGGKVGSGGVDPSLAGAKFLVSASRDQTVKFWDVETGFCDYTLTDHADWVRCLAVRPACSSSDSSSRGSGASTPRKIATVGGDGKSAAAGRKSSKENDDLDGEGDGDGENVISSLTSSSLALIASSGNDRTIYVYNAHDKREKVCELRGHDHVVESLSFLCTSLLPQTIPKTSSFKQSSAGASVTSTSSSPRDYLASGSRDRTVRLWSIANGGSCLMTFRAHENWVRGVLVHPSGNYILSCGDDRSIRVFDIKANRCLRTIEDAHSHFVTSMAMHPSLPILISGGVDHAVKCWQLD